MKYIIALLIMPVTMTGILGAWIAIEDGVRTFNYNPAIAETTVPLLMTIALMVLPVILVIGRRKPPSKSVDLIIYENHNPTPTPSKCTALVPRDSNKSSRVTRGFWNLIKYLNN